jgi:hypothetical protein
VTKKGDEKTKTKKKRDKKNATKKRDEKMCPKRETEKFGFAHLLIFFPSENLTGGFLP